MVGLLYSDCQKNVPYTDVYLLPPLMPPFLISEYKYGKRYKSKFSLHFSLAFLKLVVYSSGLIPQNILFKGDEGFSQFLEPILTSKLAYS